MSTQLYQHVLQHGEKTVLRLRKHLALFLQCELFEASASAVSTPDGEQQSPKQQQQEQEQQHQHKQQRPEQEQQHKQQQHEREKEKQQSSSTGQEENYCGIIREDNAEHVLLEQGQRSGPTHSDEEGNIHYALKTHLHVEKQLPGGTGEQQYLSTDQREKPLPAETKEKFCQRAAEQGQQIKSLVEEIEGDLHLKGDQNGKKQYNNNAPVCDACRVEHLLHSCSLTPRTAADQLAEHGHAGEEEEKNVDAQQHLFRAGTKHRCIPSHDRGFIPQVTEQKKCQQEEAANTLNQRTLANFLISSSPELPGLLKAIFLLECLPPDPFVFCKTPVQYTHRCSSRSSRIPQAEQMKQQQSLVKPTGGAHTDYCQIMQEKVKISLQFLPKASVLSRWLKNVGNALLAHQELDAAQCAYTASLRLAPFGATADGTDAQKTDPPVLRIRTNHSSAHSSSASRCEEEAGVASPPCLQHIAVLLSNRSAVRLKQQAPVAALRDATAALQVDSLYAKAWFRRGSALSQLADLFHAECSSARIPPGGLQQPPATVQQEKTESQPSFSSGLTSPAFDGTAATDAQTCCSIIERVLREEAAYSLFRSKPEQSAQVLAANAFCLDWPSTSPPRLTASACVDKTSLRTAVVPASSSRSSLSTPSLGSETVRDGETGVFSLGVCACDPAEQDGVQQSAAAANGTTKGTSHFGTGEARDEHFSTVAEPETENTPPRRTNKGTLLVERNAMRDSGAVEDPWAVNFIAEEGKRNVEAACGDDCESCGNETEKREMIVETWASHKGTRAASRYDNKTHLDACATTGDRVAPDKTTTTGNKELASVAGAAAAGVARAGAVEPASEREAHEPRRESLESFAVYVHPGIERHTGGPLGTSVHWRARNTLKDQQEAEPEPPEEDKGRDACLVLEEYPVASYCSPAQNAMKLSALPVVKRKTQFLQRWKMCMRETNIVSARAVCTGCFKTIGGPQQLEGRELVRELYRRCRGIRTVAVSAVQNGRGRATTAAKHEEECSLVRPSDKIPTGQGNIAEHPVREKRMEWKCKRLIRQFLASAELVAPCPTCSAALFCCTRCRDVSHHVAICRGSIWSGLREDRTDRTPSCPGTRSSMDNRARTEGCLFQQNTAHTEHKSALETSLSAGKCVSKQIRACAKYRIHIQDSPSLQTDGDTESKTSEQLTEEKHLSLSSTLIASRGILRAASAVACLVAAAFDEDTEVNPLDLSRAKDTLTRPRVASVAASKEALAHASAISETSFEKKLGQYFATAQQLRAVISRDVEYAVTGAAARARTTVEGNKISWAECLPESENSNSISLDMMEAHDISSNSSIRKNPHDMDTPGGETDRYEGNSSARRSESAHPYSFTATQTRALPVAYTAGGSLNDGARQLARQIFPFFLSRVSSFEKQHSSTSHPITRLAAHLPADVDKLCDFVANATWIAGEYFLKTGSTRFQLSHTFCKQPERQNNSSGTIPKELMSGRVSHGASATSNSGPCLDPAVDGVRREGSDRRPDKRNSFSALALVNEGNQNHVGNDVFETQREDETCWAWLHAPGVLEAALTAYSVAYTNSFAVRLQQDETGGWTAGRALYLFASQFNHSCTPNTLAIFDTGTPVLTADWGEEDWSGGKSNARQVVKEDEKSPECRENKKGASGIAVPTSRSGCAVRLRYYACCGRGCKDGSATNKRIKGKIRWDADKVAGEELTISYIAVAGGKRETCWNKRRRFLREQALFECRCQACEAWLTFLATTRKAGTQGFPALFDLLPDHLQGLPCRQCYSRDSKILSTQLTCKPVQTGKGHADSEGDALLPVVTLLSTSFRSRKERSIKTKHFEDELVGVFRRMQRSLLLQKGLEDVVALKGGYLLIKSIREELVPAAEQQRAWTLGATGKPLEICRSGGGPLSRSAPMCLQQRITSSASLAALGHSLLPLDDPPGSPGPDLPGDPYTVPQLSRRLQCSDTMKTSHPRESERPRDNNANSKAGTDSNTTSYSRNGSRGSCSRSGPAALCEGLVERSVDFLECVRGSAYQRISDRPDVSRTSGSCSEGISRVDDGHSWTCLRCGFIENDRDSGDLFFENPEVDAVRRSVEGSLRECGKVPDPLKRGEHLLQYDKSREVELSNLLVRMAHTRGQLSHEVSSVLDIWARWSTECAAIAADTQSELFLEWSRANTLGRVDTSVDARCSAVAKLGSRLPAVHERNLLLAFQLHLSATWVHSLRFPRSWQQPELCTELYKSAILAGNAGRIREGLLLAKAAEYSGTAAYGPTHPIVYKIKKLCASFQ